MLHQECHQLSNLHKLAVLILMLHMVGKRTTFECGMLLWLHKEVNRLKVSSGELEESLTPVTLDP